MDLSHCRTLDYARDMFLFSFYTRGMSFVDMAYLKKNDLKNGVLIYRRKKTGQQLCIRWERHMQDILEKYPMSQESPYLLPIILKAGEEERKQYNNALHLVNKKLKFISNSLQLTIPLTMYVARILGPLWPKAETFRFLSSAKEWDTTPKYNADLFGLTQYGNHRQSQQAHFKPTLNLQRQVHLFPRDGFGLQKYDKQWINSKHFPSFLFEIHEIVELYIEMYIGMWLCICAIATCYHQLSHYPSLGKR